MPGKDQHLRDAKSHIQRVRGILNRVERHMDVPTDLDDAIRELNTAIVPLCNAQLELRLASHPHDHGM